MNLEVFDTLKFYHALQVGGMPNREAEALTFALAEVLRSNVDNQVTKAELDRAIRNVAVVNSAVPSGETCSRPAMQPERNAAIKAALPVVFGFAMGVVFTLAALLNPN